MNPPFTTEEFLGVLKNYNLGVFPWQIVLLLPGILAVVFLHIKSNIRHKFIGLLLGFISLWTGVLYHFMYFTEINVAAWGFGGLFMLQGFLFLFATFQKDKLRFNIGKTFRDYLGYFLVIFGLVIYPVIGYLIDGSAEHIISFGLPCPVTIFIFGMLMLTARSMPKYLLITPTIWAVIGFMAAVNFGIYQDVMLLVSAIVADVFLLIRKREK